MVIILQQTLEDGQRFVSTVIEGSEETSFTSNFSMNSQHSISERSAVYKQRIDSLFGRPSRRLSPFLPMNTTVTGVLDSSSSSNNNNISGVQINGKSVTPLIGCREGGGGGRRILTTTPSTIIHHPHIDEDEDDDEDSYSRITDKTSTSSSSIITDSLNHRGIKNACPSSNSINVSSVRITCDAETDTTTLLPPQPQSILISSGSPSHDQVTVNHPPRSSSSILISSASPSSSSSNNNNNINHKGGNNIGGNNNMWRNGSYGESVSNNNSSEDKSLGFVSTPGGMLQFSVEYLGSVPVDGTTTSLQDLQTPLKNLYSDFLSRKNVMTGQLAITSDGIRFEAPKLRLVNPFSTIAVWAAIKFVARGEPLPTECAFMPLISDPEGQDKSRLFAPMDSDFGRVYLTCLSGSKNGFKNPPLFACVMREASFSLDCHAFACKCAEDAIVVAANLYQSLVDKMRSGHPINKEGESGYGSLTRTSPSGIQSSPNQNHNRSSSSASSSGLGGNEARPNGGTRSGGRTNLESGPSSSSGPDDHRHEHRTVFSDSESVIPIRPPRRKKKYSEIPSGNLKRYNSEDSVLLKMPHRRKSFKRNYQSKPKKRVQISTPDETSSGDSIHESSIDQVLDRIINPGGMSFNDLKPTYQDLILKIALTLTQDQLYQKSKQAMKKQQNYLRKKSKRFSSSNGDVSDDNSQFLNHLLKSFSKITSKSPTSKQHRFSKNGMLNKTGGGPLQSNHPTPAPRKVILKKSIKDDDTAFMSFCSGCICESCSEKCYCSLPSKTSANNNKLLLHDKSSSSNPTKPIIITTSTATSTTPCPMGTACIEKKDKKQRKLCGYDSESCAESEKCYCEINQIKSNGLKIYNINLDTETSDTDTNSYDLEPFNQHQESSSSNGKTVSTRSVEILSYHPSKRLAYNLSPGLQHMQTTSAIVHFEDSLNIQSSINTQCALPNGKGSSPYCNGQKLECSDLKKKAQRDKVLLITGSSPSARVVYKDAQQQSYQHGPLSDGKKSRNGIHRNLIDIMEDECNEEDTDGSDTDTGEDGIAPEKVLSMKKTAEIAAMFTDLKLDQTTNVVPDLTSNNFESMQHAEDSTASLDFEASLGYLP